MTKHSQLAAASAFAAACAFAIGCGGADPGAATSTADPLSNGNQGEQGSYSGSGTPPAADAGAPADTGAPPGDTGTVSSDTGAAKYVTHYVTWYGWPDNDPPGTAIAYPKVHTGAGGVGTYANPITFATDKTEFAPGTILYVPFIKKYVIMEDYCAACISDWKSGKRHIDIWMNSDNNNTSKLLSCQYSWTRDAVDIEIDPPKDRPVTTAPLFDTSTAVCRKTP